MQKLHFPLKEYMDGYFCLSLEEHFLQPFFLSFIAVFFLGQGENTPRKKTRRNSVNENSLKSGEIPIRKNVGKIMENVGSRRRTPKSAKLAC